MNSTQTKLAVIPLILLMGVAIAIVVLTDAAAASAQGPRPRSSLLEGSEPITSDPHRALNGVRFAISQATLTAVADSWVDQAHPSSNYGNSTRLGAYNNDQEWS